jgi:hypothetical protein
MKNNLRHVFTCCDCKHEVSDEYYPPYCNLDNSAPCNWWKSENQNWRIEHFVGEYSICDDFEEEI